VSVVLPTFDGIGYVGAALASVRAQSLDDWEVVCVDTGSADGTPELLRAIARDDPRVRLVAQEPGLTPPQARNRALSEARGEFLAPLDQDDTMRPGRLALQVAALRSDSVAPAVGARFSTLDRSGLVATSESASDPAHVGWPSSPAATRWSVAVWCPTTSSSTCYRTAALRAVGGFDEEHPLCDDYALLWRLVEESDVAVLPDVVAGVRHHADQLSSTRRSRQAWEVLLLRQRIVHARLGRRADLGALAALHRPRPEDDDETRAAATQLVEDLAAWGLAQPGLAPADAEWIGAEAQRLAARLRRGGTPPEPRAGPGG
jgi:glycosyltransferase involved in cell wall biosynthesis